MYNSYKKGTEAWYLMQDAISVHNEAESAADGFEEVMTRACDELETMEESLNEVSEERDQIQRDYDELEDLLKSVNVDEMLRVLNNIRQYATDHIEKLEAARGNKDEDSDSGAGDSGDGGSEDTPGQATAEDPAGGITRPQIP